MRDKLQEIIKDAQENTYSDSPRFVDGILALFAPVIEKARKWDEVKRISSATSCSDCPCKDLDCLIDGMCLFTRVVSTLTKKEDGDEH